MKMLLRGEWVGTDDVIEVRNPFDGSLIDSVPMADAAMVEAALEYAAGYDFTLSAWERYEILMRFCDRLRAEAGELRRIISMESGKPLAESDIEINRSLQTFMLSAEEAKRINGESLPVDTGPGLPHTTAFTLREPLGVIAAISPFNYPLNLVAHKVAPALAANNAVVLKPAEKTPLTALRMGEMLLDAGLPPRMLQVLTGDPEVIGGVFTSSPVVRKITFTGSVPVGKAICAKAGMQSVCMELGGNDPLIVLGDADLDKAVPAAVNGAFGNNGERCTSIKRIIIEDRIADAFAERFVAETERLVVGDQLDPATDVGPLITEAAAAEIEERIRECVSSGASVLAGGRREGALLWPTILDRVPPDSRLVQEETFGPVAPLLRVPDFEAAIRMSNSTPYGLQAGVFTNDLEKAMVAARRLEVGAVMLNKPPGFRAEHLPFGGVKDSGIGREGIRYAIEAMTTLKTVVL